MILQDSITPSFLYLLRQITTILSNYQSHQEELCDLISIISNVLYVNSSKELIIETINWGISIELLHESNGNITLTNKAKESFLPLNELDFYHLVIKDHLVNEKPFWLAFYCEDYDVFCSSLPSAWQEILSCVGLLDFSKESNTSWWQSLIQVLHTYEDDLRVVLGKLGEKFTMDFERERLAREGIDLNNYSISWVSQFSDLFGYDISSISGSYNQEDPYKRILIETKTSGAGNVSHFRFFISRNEWETLEKNLNNYYLYLWYGVDKSDKEPIYPPKIIQAKQLRNVFPEDKSTSGKWMTAQIVLDLTKF